MSDVDDGVEAGRESIRADDAPPIAESGRGLMIAFIASGLAAVVLVAGILLLRSGDGSGPGDRPADGPGTQVGTATANGGSTPAEPHTEASLEKAYRRLISQSDWESASPERNEPGLWRAVHLKTGLTFLLIPPGSFEMGSPEDEEGRDVDERQRLVSIKDPFLLCETECTQAAWDKVGGDDRRQFEGETLPIDGVSWDDAREWCAKVDLRLPTEAEWEYACRAGTVTPYSFGVDEEELEEHGWFDENTTSMPQHVATREPNPWGLYDMYGNVREWCEDVYHEDFEGAPVDGSALQEGPSGHRVIRGGGFTGPAKWSRSASRARFDPTERISDLSFRPARDL